jgi:hypothetical protein
MPEWSVSDGQLVGSPMSIPVSSEPTMTVQMMKSILHEHIQTILTLSNSLTTRAEFIDKSLSSVRAFTSAIEGMSIGVENQKKVYQSEICKELAGDLLSVLNILLFAPNEQELEEKVEVHIDDLSAFGLILFKHYVSLLRPTQLDNYLYVFGVMLTRISNEAPKAENKAVYLNMNYSCFLKLFAEAFLSFYPRVIQRAIDIHGMD